MIKLEVIILVITAHGNWCLKCYTRRLTLTQTGIDQSLPLALTHSQPKLVAYRARPGPVYDLPAHSQLCALHCHNQIDQETQG